MKKQQNSDNFIHSFLHAGKPIGNDFDWINPAKTARYFECPPSIPENIRYFADALKEIVKEKLNIALDAQKALVKSRKMRIKMILEEIPEEKQWFYFALEKYLFAEYFLISAWIRHWLDIWYRINKSYRPPVYSQNKFSDIEIQRAKEYPIERFYNGTLRNSGKRFVGLCPFHKEKTPSFFIFENNTWHCFGACSTGGDAINFAMKLYDISFPIAVRRLLYGHF